MAERLAISANNDSVCAFSKRELPRVIFAEATALVAGAALQLGTFGCVLKADILRNVVVDENQPISRITAPFQKFGNRNAAHDQVSLRAAAIFAKPSHCRASDTSVDLSFQVDQKRRVKQRGSHDAPFVLHF
ncbi:MAG TPA: hypothetical protein VKC60_08955 [Opitutaceae bacterium]|nr:hypothetical protein [Opitutaceae bacterium]